MYAAKANGRHTFSVFSPSPAQMIKQRLQLRQEVFSALERRQFVLFYQPQISAPTAPWSAPRPCCAGSTRAWA
jgi:predicted signal transduction protein with EAL and GGDEF domain